MSYRKHNETPKKRVPSNRGTSGAGGCKRTWWFTLRRWFRLTTPKAIVGAALITRTLGLLALPPAQPPPDPPAAKRADKECPLTRGTVFKWVVVDATLDFVSTTLGMGTLSVQFQALAQNLGRQPLTWTPELDDLAGATEVTTSVASLGQPFCRQVLEEIRHAGAIVGYRAPTLEFPAEDQKYFLGGYRKTIRLLGFESISIERPVMDYLLVRVHLEHPEAADGVAPRFEGYSGGQDEVANAFGMEWCCRIRGPHSGPSVVLIWGPPDSGWQGPLGFDMRVSPFDGWLGTKDGRPGGLDVYAGHMTAWSRGPDTIPRPETIRICA